MNRVAVPLTFLLLVLALPSAWAHPDHIWSVTSPTHAQTFTYGSERYRSWGVSGGDNPSCLVLNLSYTNDPYVNEDYTRLQDDFTFVFPSITLQPDGQTLAYRAADGRIVPVARKAPGFLGIPEVKLLPNCELILKKPHGYLTAKLLVADYILPSAND